ncbi:hypothetical protein ACLKA6_005010 [Drosophila palustris]
MKLLFIFACLLSLALGHELIYGYFTANGLTYAHHTGGSVVPLAYARLVAPATQSHVYHSVQTPSSFQQQYRTDYQPLTYEYLY